MKIAELAWLAGMMDGEGCIGLYEYTRTKIPRHRVIRGMVTIVNTHKPTMETIADFYQELGVTYYWRHNETRLGWKDSYFIVLQNRESIDILLTAISPYLVTKKKQAEICLQFVKREKYSRMTLSDSDLLARIKVLNKKGEIDVT